MLEDFDEGVPVLGLVVGAVDEDEVVGFGHGCGDVSFCCFDGLSAVVVRFMWYRGFFSSENK